MLSKQESLRQTIIVGWITLLQLVVVMFVVSLISSAIANDFSAFGKDPGYLGLNIMIVVFAIYAAIPILVRAFNGNPFRWFMVGISIFFFLFFIAHQLTHMIVDKMPLSLYSILDFSHHFIILWIIVCTIRWARIPSTDA